MEISWSQFKTFITERSVGCNYLEIGDNYHLKAYDNSFSVSCLIPIDRTLSTDTADFEDNFKEGSNKNLKNSVQTQFEREDILLQVACTKNSFVNNISTASLKVPGTPGSGDGRYIAGGYSFTDIHTFGDKIKYLNVVDIDNLLGYGVNTILRTYHDTSADVENQGWYFWPSPQAGGEVEIDPLGYYGFVPSGLYIQITAEAISANNLFCNIWWGKQE